MRRSAARRTRIGSVRSASQPLDHGFATASLSALSAVSGARRSCAGAGARGRAARSKINVQRAEGGDEDKFVLSMQAQYGCGKSSASQMPWLAMYILNATASVLDIALSIQQVGGAGV